MQVKIAKCAGFCTGVALALKKLDNLLKDTDKKVVTLGPIIHNPQVLEEYKKLGVDVINSVDEINDNMCVLIRAHGISKQEEEIARVRAYKLIDATCPKVKKLQLAVENATLKAKNESLDSLLLIYGEGDHPEIKGVVSYSNIDYLVFLNPEEIYEKINVLPDNIIIVAQTTQDIEAFTNFTKKLQSMVNKKINVINTICSATKERQEAVKELAAEVDVVIVIGGKNSGNTRRLADISLDTGKETYHIETVSELDITDKQKELKFGLTAGASTPTKYIDDVKEFIEAL